MRPYPRADLVVVGVAAASFLALIFTAFTIPCTPAEPCAADPVMSAAVAMWPAAAVMTFLHRWAAAAAAVLGVVLWVVAGEEGWTVLLPASVAVTTLFVARLRLDAPQPAAITRRAPRPDVLPSAATSTAVAGAALLVAALAGTGLVLRQQDRVAGQEAAADRSTAVVREHLDEGTAIRIELTDGSARTVEVGAAADYPLGSTVELLTDGTGLQQLTSEPYDITILLLALCPAAGAGIALLARAAGWRRELRRLFDVPQPVHAARILDRYDEISVLVPGAPGSATQFVLSVAPDPAYEEPQDEEVHTEPAQLYGDPAPGRWCAVVVDGRVRTPLRPVAAIEWVPYDAARGLPAGIDDDGEPSVDPDDLTAPDRHAASDEIREHRKPGWLAWTRTALAGVTAGAAAAATTVDLPTWAAGAIVLAATAAAHEWAWRYELRPRLRWHRGGLSAVTPWRPVTFGWTPETTIDEPGDGTVQVSDGSHEVTARVPGMRLSGRTPTELATALRHSRRLALDDGRPGDPPEAQTPARPWTLPPATALTVALCVLVLRPLMLAP